MKLKECLEFSKCWGEKTSNVFSIFALHGTLGIREIREKYQEIYGKKMSITTARIHVGELCVSSFVCQVDRNKQGKVFYDIKCGIDEKFIDLMKNDI